MFYQKYFQDVDGKCIVYVDEGEGDLIVLLYGNFIFLYLWCNVILELVGSGWVIVLDLIGQGDLEKLLVSEGSGCYGFLIVYYYLSGLLVVLGLDWDVILVVYDWGSGLGFYWVSQYLDVVKVIVYMEVIVMLMIWDDWLEFVRGIFQGFCLEKGEDLIFKCNRFVEVVLFGLVLCGFIDVEMVYYCCFFEFEEDCWLIFNWFCEIFIEGEFVEMVWLVEYYGCWLVVSLVFKLFVNVDLGLILIGCQWVFCWSWLNQIEVIVKGSYFLQEDLLVEIGQVVVCWLVVL